MYESVNNDAYYEAPETDEGEWAEKRAFYEEELSEHKAELIEDD